ncbi:MULTISPECIES: ATP-grasp domain-containing protein [Bacillota]|uniref:ATP-grasp domain-containing protein n=1 Tax=Bacillota TaxID=1239 RepID=UPI0019619E9F|nr:MULTISPECIES: ATP-grasp domain-containing protein [Bacillota]MBM6966857.1 ATP-grasp domain-containing protein [Massilimicrobiota timonensis]QUN11996.1 ATP-grasp domain-containing protein [Clostridium sp. C1]
MNFVYISPSFPKNFYQFCNRLKLNGVTVLAIADTPYDQLSEELKNSIDDYYQVYSMENYDEMIKAMGYFIFHYGHIDWLESNNEYWLEQDAKLRTDFNITTGIHTNHIEDIKCKSKMKKFYEEAGVKTARYHLVTNLDEGLQFIEKVGYPVVVKPDNGVGAAKTYKISNQDELEKFYQEEHVTQYIMEEFVNGLIISYDGIANLDKDIIFETSHVFPNPIMDVVNDQSSMYYYSLREIPYDLKQAGHACVKAFYTAGRCFHMEFFKLLEDKEGLGKKGDIIGLEVNLRTPGGYTPDMMNFANDIDVYQIYADMVTKGYSEYDHHRPYHCVYCGRRDGITYTHSHEDIISQYHFDLVMCERMPDILSGAMGNFTYTARFENMEQVDAFVQYVLG